MDDGAREQLERDVRTACDRGDPSRAATLAIRGYGPEIYGFLIAVHRSEQDANDVFAAVAEVIWRGLTRFEWESSLRTWAYAVARNVSRTFRRDEARRARRAKHVGTSALEDVAQAVRTETLEFLRTEKRTKLKALREALEPEDRMLLVLRVDRRLEWADIARVLSDASGPRDEIAVAREAARLRKRFSARQREDPRDVATRGHR
jgi:RNA polymerase sigma-70 factor (ECF subfamily)